MLMALRFVLARLFSARGPLIVAAATTATTAVTAMAAVAAVAAVAKQMHADEQDEKHNPNPVLR
jgi:hypothetical protein